MPFDVRKSLRKYFIMGSQDCKRDPAEILKAAAAGGITAFQFREKGKGALTGEAKVNLGKELRAICRQNKIPFIMNDDVELVNVLDADGIHVGQGDTSVVKLRKLFPEKIIGLSVSRNELADSPLEYVDYVGAGDIFGTSSKTHDKSAVGLEWIAELSSQYPNLPIVGIGGINTRNAASVIEAGADGVSVISAIAKADNIEETVKQL
ncbi:thiamine phosphate synthase [Virgibacillus sp. YIM 98842]|jgi:thiamine-phosphate pyrophosphorylase|uniref:thiamine phosphate synthase n=1 Tax=Virgibacillus sp. YIM 98842 TaxID=2663533 RepID=UPI0013DB9DF7|nr:thiamine phosphate synthase [Virgibacillus sp. YIM 98842]